MDTTPEVPKLEASVDVLADVFRAVRLRGTAYFHAAFRAPWGMRIDRRDIANFHVVTSGSCEVRWDDGDTQLHDGDLVVFPHGMDHVLRSDEDAVVEPAATLLATRREAAPGRLEFGATGDASQLICGHFELDRRGAHPLLESLPAVLLLRRGEGPNPGWVETASRLAVLESESGQPGSEAIVDRLAEALMIQLVRAHAARSQHSVGFMAALADPLVGPALSLMHDDPALEWSVELVARRIGASRSRFASHFKDLLGVGPMQYLTHWRMLSARALLTDDGLSIAAIAERVGYRSEFAFAKAFKRVFGTGPGAARRSAS